MPQLNPAPWFYIMVALWLITTLLLMPHILNLSHTPKPTLPTTTHVKSSWHWTWQ